MLAAVFKFPLPEISSSPILKDLIRSFEISAPRPIFPPPPWDLDKVLEFLSGPPFEPLARASFLDKTKKALFLLAMATAKRVSELQACHSLCHSRVRIWSFITTRSSVQRQRL